MPIARVIAAAIGAVAKSANKARTAYRANNVGADLAGLGAIGTAHYAMSEAAILRRKRAKAKKLSERNFGQSKTKKPGQSKVRKQSYATEPDRGGRINFVMPKANQVKPKPSFKPKKVNRSRRSL